MAERVHTFRVTCPRNTPVATPLEVATVFSPGTVQWIEVEVPSGHNGETGLQLAVAHQPVIPETAGTFIVANATTLHWEVAGFLNTGSWAVFLYNTDVYDHSWYVRFGVLENRPTALLVVGQPAQVIPVSGDLAPEDVTVSELPLEVPPAPASEPELVGVGPSSRTPGEIIIPLGGEL